jgi:TolA-binding protein
LPIAVHHCEYPASGVSRKRIEKCRCIGHIDGVGEIYMNPKVKLAAYAVLLILAEWFGLAFRSYYAAVTSAAAAEGSDAAQSSPAAPQPTNSQAPAPPSTNGVTNLAALTTNASGDATNAPAAPTNATAAEPAPRAASANPPAAPAAADMSSARGAMIRYLAGFVVVVIGLGALVAVDVTQYFGGQAGDYLFFDVGDAMRDPLYERAEAEWANGTYLEAVQLLRDYLKKNPRELHASLRIAEIYEKDLKNYLASALEYEEVLKHKLPAERWGWAAIHLCNLYSKLNHQDKTRDLLHRIVNEYPQTAAARKARVRLGLAEAEEEPVTEETVETSQEPIAPQLQDIHDVQDEPEAPPPPEPPKPNLPPGFRPKK